MSIWFPLELEIVTEKPLLGVVNKKPMKTSWILLRLYVPNWSIAILDLLRLFELFISLYTLPEI